MLHSLCGCHSAVFIVDEHLIQEIDSIRGDSAVVVHVNKGFKGHCVCVLNQLHELLWHVEAVFPHVVLQVLSAHYINDFYQLIVVVSSFKERICLEHETSQRASDRPHVQRIVVFLVFYKKFRSLVIATCNPNIVFVFRLVEVCQSPIDQTQISLVVVNHNVQGLHISVHDSMDMRILQCFQHLVGVQSDVHVVEFAGQNFRLLAWNVLEHQRRRLAHWVTQDVCESHNIWPTIQCLEDFDFTILFLNANRLQDFDDAFFIVFEVTPLVDLRVFASAEFVVAIVVVEAVPVKVQLFVVREALWAFRAHELVWPSEQSIFDFLLARLLTWNRIHHLLVVEGLNHINTLN